MMLVFLVKISIILVHLSFQLADTTNTTIYGRCNFAQPAFPFQNEMTVYALVPEIQEDLKILFCNVWYNSSEGVLRLWLQKTSQSKQAALLSTVLDARGSLVLPGYITEAEEDVVYPFHICPPRDESSKRNYTIYLSGPPNTGINLTVQVDESIMGEEQTKSVEFGFRMSSRLLVFDVSNTQGIYDHFLVTVRSDDTQQECLLIVSKDCSDVVNIDPGAISFKDSGSAMYLSFTTFGRITLSHASSPQLSTGRWFIGVFLKRRHGSPDPTVKKIVQVSVGFAGGINHINLTLPVTRLVTISIFVGLAIALFADFFLNPEFEHWLLHTFRQYLNTSVFSSTHHTDEVDANDLEVLEQMNAASKKKDEQDSSPSPSVILNSDANYSSPTQAGPYDMSRLKVAQHWPGFKKWVEVFFRWFYDEEKTFSYTTAIVAFSLLTGAAQFIISNWRDMIDSGNRDICYYNEGCYRTTSKVDMPYNLIISNLCYVIHGLILALSISLREATRRVNEAAGSPSTTKKSFSIAYAFAWGLVFQGVFSALYHLCPSRMTFQFDSAFMFVISGLVVVAVFNSLAEKSRQRSSDQCECGGAAPVRDSKLYLFFVIPILLLNYLGSIRDTEGFLLFPNGFFYCLAILWIVAMFLWAFYRLMLPWKPKPGPSFWCKSVWLCLLFPVILLVIGLYTVDVKRDWSHFFLFTCLASVMCAVLGSCLARCSQNIYKRAKRRQHLSAGERKELQWKLYFKWPLVNFHVLFYSVCLAACWGMALYYFQRKPVTDKVKLPSVSRELNEECILWEFFDDHDMWHILSSFALLLTAYLIIWSIG